VALLEVRDLSVRFGGVVALDRVSFDVGAGELVALIGPNGAGKTTLFNVITRVYRPSGGTVLVDGRSIHSIRPHDVIRHGLARTFQNLALFRSMTVLENVLVGDHTRTRSGWLEASVPLPSATSAEAASRKRAIEMLDFVGMSALAQQPVAILPFGLQKRVELARALVSRPRLLLLDEPLASLDRARKLEIIPYLAKLRDEAKVPMIYVSHQAGEIQRLCSQVVRIEDGQAAATGGLELLDEVRG
jgi:branched-chain amino acid transport system ATP-binding protein